MLEALLSKKTSRRYRRVTILIDGVSGEQERFAGIGRLMRNYIGKPETIHQDIAIKN